MAHADINATSPGGLSPPESVRRLIEQFQRDRESYVSEHYNEARLRREFLDPFFEALGWDMANRQGYADAYTDVIHEDSIKIGSATKAPDYCFRIGGTRKFFLEAKRPTVALKSDGAGAYQLRRYAWSAGLPLSILSNFDAFAVYDCRVRPSQDDAPATARIFYCTAGQIAAQWSFFVNTFSRQGILTGAFDKYVESSRHKRGTAEFDVAFLAEIEGWRKGLAENLALRNPTLTQRDLNFAVTRTIDRIIFLRIAEDRGIEPYGRLLGVANGPGVYPRLVAIFQDADARYNSGLFHFSAATDRHSPPDALTPELLLDDKVLSQIITSMYYPESPYEFSVVSADILGQVYEQFLGRIIRLTEGHRAKIEWKPEVRKAGGVYYTRKDAVDFIVREAVGPLVKNATPAEAAGIKILDPACGSGSFLLGAYQFLLDWHLEYYAKNNPGRWLSQKKPPVREIARQAAGRPPQGAERGLCLTTTKRKEILLNSIFGVDIDANAVETTKLSLLLKVLEGESAETLAAQLRLFRQRALPDIGDNVRCGNSLIEPDIYRNQQFSLLDDEVRHGINAFDWCAEFPAVMDAGGFDAVVGNPPYLFITEVPPEQRTYYQTHYNGVDYRFDLYGCFLEKTARRLLKKSGIAGFIIPHTLLGNASFGKLRSLLSAGVAIRHVLDVGPGMFRAKNETMLLFFSRDRPTPRSKVLVQHTTAKTFPTPRASFSIAQKKWAPEDGGPWVLHASPEAAAFVNIMREQQRTMGSLCTINQGARTGDNARYLSASPSGPLWRPAIAGRDVSRYGPITPRIYIYYDPAVLDAPRRPELFFCPEKIVVQEVRNIGLPRRIVATLDQRQGIGLQSTNVVQCRPGCPLDLLCILGLLNSPAVNAFFRVSFPGNHHIPSNHLAVIPIPEVPSAQALASAMRDTCLPIIDAICCTPGARPPTSYYRQTGERKVKAMLV